MIAHIRFAFPLAAVLALSACQSTTPETPLEELLDQGSRAAYGAANCQEYGGLRASRRLNDAADATYAKARQMGATGADIQASKIRASQQAQQWQTLYGNRGTCNRLLQFPEGYTPPTP
ncbi:hypothetical protein [Martelella limonii]|uniref:hypothetical protein n=1 Tax=Martelella limonii TaxID=1647649 RepID=UPI001580BE1D|nr:hypothetical protein [Martelella limonii]